jgi:hypothetical protein
MQDRSSTPMALERFEGVAQGNNVTIFIHRHPLHLIFSLKNLPIMFNVFFIEMVNSDCYNYNMMFFKK